MLTASKKSQDGLLDRERGFKDKQRQRILKNNPNALIGPTVNPPAGDLTNIRSKDGSELIPGSGSSTAHIPKGWNGDINTLEKGYALGLGKRGK